MTRVVCRSGSVKLGHVLMGVVIDLSISCSHVRVEGGGGERENSL